MPELPEVETVRRGLHAVLKGSMVEKVALRRANLRIPLPPDLAGKLAGRTIQSIERRAKYLLFYFDSEDVLIAHLGMTGRFSVHTKIPKTFDKHDHVVFYLEDSRCVIFNDARRFGLMTLVKKKQLATHPLLASMGPEPLDKTFSSTYLKGALLRRKGPVKPALMDQQLVVGVGNIYASEALFLAGISPRRSARDVAQKSPELIKAVRKVLNAAIASGGSSLRDFVDISGEAGYFQHRFLVYGREGKPCSECTTPIQTIRQSGRTTFFCKRCQR